MYQRSSFLPIVTVARIEENGIIRLRTMDWYGSPLARCKFYAKGNMANISKKFPIIISKTLGVIENAFIEVDCSPIDIEIYTALFKEYREIFTQFYREMPKIDPSIVKHEI